MRQIHIAVVALCAAAIACGGNDGNTSSNAAASKIFTFSTPITASAGEKSAVQAPLGRAAAIGGSSGAAFALASFSSMTSGLLGSTGAAFSRSEVPAPGLKEGSSRRVEFNPNCISVSGNTYTYKNCQITFAGAGFSGTETFDGTISLSSDHRTVNWDLTVRLDLSGEGGSEKLQVHQSGTVTMGSNRISGDLRVEVSVSSTTGSTAAFAFDEDVTFDLTYQSTPFCVTSGSVEVKRVWTRQPGQAQPDKAVKLVWTGCNQATIAKSI